MRSSILGRIMRMMMLLPLLLLPSTTTLAFQAATTTSVRIRNFAANDNSNNPHQRKRRITTSTTVNHYYDSSSSTTSTTTSLRMTMMNSFEDVMFHAQSTASSLASISLDDPSNLVSSIPIMYGAGLLTAFSPCVWGLLPLTISYISNAAGERKDASTTLPTVAFAAGLASVFCTLGLIASSVGGAVYGNSANTNIALPLVSNAICCVMGFQLLELINLPLPALSSSAATTGAASLTIFNGSSRTRNDDDDKTDDLILIDGSGNILKDKSGSGRSFSSSAEEQGSLFRTFLLGGSSALVASPCATPVLTSILAFVANSSNPLLGGFLLLFYTLGYSTPLLVTAATGGQALVRLKELGGKDETSVYAKVAPWITPFTAGILLWYGTNGLLTTVLGDPSLAGLLTIG